jgi:hypothetical protein
MALNLKKTRHSVNSFRRLGQALIILSVSPATTLWRRDILRRDRIMIMPAKRDTDNVCTAEKMRLSGHAAHADHDKVNHRKNRCGASVPNRARMRQ